MYAITTKGYRAIASVEDLLQGETAVDELPASLLATLAIEDGRQRRNEQLRASDWTQVQDCPLSVAERTAWATYRQALRDLPEVAGFPDCEWPAPPATPQTPIDGN